MSLDIANASRVAGGESFVPAPITVDGLFIEPPIETLCSQATGTGATVLRARYTSGRVRLFDKAIDVAGDEVILANQSGYEDQAQTAFASGQAQWFTLVAVQTRKTGAIVVRWVPGVIAAVASAVVKTLAEIATFLDLDDDGCFVVLGDVQFHRSGDLVIGVKTTAGRRPAYVQTTSKTTVTQDAASPDGMEEVDGGWLDLPITYASAFALTAGDLYVKGKPPRGMTHGGRISSWELICAVSGAGAGADMTLKIQIDGVVVTGSDTQLLLATTAIAAGGTVVAGGAISALDIFKQGSSIAIEVDAKPTAFTGGSGVLRLYLRKFQPIKY